MGTWGLETEGNGVMNPEGEMCKVFIRDPSRRTVQLLCFAASDEQSDWNKILKISKSSARVQLNNNDGLCPS